MKLTYAALLALLLAVALFFSECDAKNKNKRRGGGGRRGKGKGRPGRPGRRRHRPIPGPILKPLHPLDCGPIPHIDHAQALQTPDEIHYACEPGFRLEGTNVITCMHGRWTVAPRCVRQVCPIPSLVAFANPPQLSASGTVVTYTCQSGYKIVNGNGMTSQTLHCNLGLRQWPALPQCEPILDAGCGAPPSISHANSEVSGNVATYTCHNGYIRKSGTPSQIVCKHGHWSYNVLPACIDDPSRTPPPPKCLKAPPCGDSTIMRGDVADMYDVGSKVTYTCITGYKIAGQNDNSIKQADVECKSDGTWEDVPTCDPVVCGQPSHAVGGNTQVIAAGALTFGSQYTYMCLNLYEVSASTPMVATCNAAGEWSIDPPICTLKFCKYPPPTLANGSPFGLDPNANIPVGTKVQYQCSDGYRIAPSPPGDGGVLQIIECLESGNFSPFEYSCVPRNPPCCEEYFIRDGQFATTADDTNELVTVDPDGSGGLDPFTVRCRKLSATQVRTEIAPMASTDSLTGEVDACTGGDTDILDGVGFVPGPAADTEERSGVCDEQDVVYTVSAAQMSSLLTNCCCQDGAQEVSISCSEYTAGEDANLLALKLNGKEGTAHSGAGTELGQLTMTITPTVTGADLLLANSERCDCGDAGTCDTGCECSTMAALDGDAGEDTITIPLTVSQLQYVTKIARVAGARDDTNAVDPALADSEFDVTVGDITCVETISA